MWYQLALNKTFCPILSPSPTDNNSTNKEQKQKLTKQYFLHSPHLFSTQSSLYQNWKGNKYSILTLIEPGRPVLESSTRFLKFYVPTDFRQKFHKTGIKNWLLIGFNLGSSWLRTRSHSYYTMFNRSWGEIIHIPVYKVLE